MHSLIGALDLLSTGELCELTDQGKQILSVAISNAERLIRLVSDILDLERLKSAEITLKQPPAILNVSLSKQLKLCK